MLWFDAFDTMVHETSRPETARRIAPVDHSPATPEGELDGGQTASPPVPPFDRDSAIR